MKKLYVIHYWTDTGYAFEKDFALIKATDEEKAKEILREYIRNRGNEYCVSEIVSVEEFDGYVFTGKFGYGIL